MDSFFKQPKQKAKPQRWAPVSPALIAPEWRWAWRGLVAHYPMWERGGAPFDLSLNGNHATLPGGTANPTWVASERGWVLDFDGSDDFVDAGDINELDSASQATLTMWAKRDTGSSYIAFSKYTDFDERINIIWNGNNDTVFFTVANGEEAEGSVALNDQEWHHFALVFDGSKSGNSSRLKGYIDGVGQSLSFTGTIPSSTANHSSNLQIGQSPFSNFSDGLMDDVRVYNRALSAAEVAALYRDPFGPVRMQLPMLLGRAPVAAVNRRRVIIGT